MDRSKDALIARVAEGWVQEGPSSSYWKGRDGFYWLLPQYNTLPLILRATEAFVRQKPWRSWSVDGPITGVTERYCATVFDRQDHCVHGYGPTFEAALAEGLYKACEEVGDGL